MPVLVRSGAVEIVEEPPAAGLKSHVRVAGAWVQKPVLVKAGGVFAEKPVTAR